ncbi:MAG: acyl carrier protein [Bdellovibrionales bacterium]|nr:acyl carrier protein [Bdellovibrionales bacterium]
MDREAFEARLHAAFESMFPSAKGDVRELRRGSGAWDSFAHIELINRLESSFAIRLSTEAALSIKDFSSAMRAIESIDDGA